MAVLHWGELVRRSNEQLAPLDLVEVNLACAEGLPGSEKIDRALCVRTCDHMAACVGQFTEHYLPRFHANPAK